MTKKNRIVIDSGMGFFRWLYLGIILMQIAGVIDWPWQWVLAPIIFLVLIGFLVWLYPEKGE